MFYTNFQRLFVGIIRGYDNTPTEAQYREARVRGIEMPYFASRFEYEQELGTIEVQEKMEFYEIQRRSIELQEQSNEQLQGMFENVAESNSSLKEILKNIRDYNPTKPMEYEDENEL